MNSDKIVKRVLFKLGLSKNSITWKQPSISKELHNYFGNSEASQEFKKHGLSFESPKTLASFLKLGKLQKVSDEELSQKAKNITLSIKDFDEKLEDQNFKQSFKHLEKSLETENLNLEAPILIKFNDGTYWGFSGNRRANLARKHSLPILYFVVNQKDLKEED